MADQQKRTDGEQHDMSDRNDGNANLLNSSFRDLFSGGASVWGKIVGGAIVAPAAVAVVAVRAIRRQGTEHLEDPVVIAVVLIGAAIVGAVLGGLLSLKDVVHTRLAAGRPVSFPLKLLFGFGMLSLILVWVPAIFFLALIVTMLIPI